MTVHLEVISDKNTGKSASAKKPEKEGMPLYVVGERFSHFANNETVLTVKQLMNLLDSYKADNIYQIYDLYAGQGLTDENDKFIGKLIGKLGLQPYFHCEESLLPAKRADSYMTHKNKSKNTMISEPLQLSDNQYESYLMIDENCAEASDHLTGQHIQGAVLMEAARQMTLAVTEKFFIKEEFRDKVSFVSKSVRTNFFNYAFPLEVKIHYEIKKRRGLVSQNTRFVVLVTFYQNNEAVSEVTYDFSTLSKNYIRHKEKEAARSVIWNAIRSGGWHEKTSISIA